MRDERPGWSKTWPVHDAEGNPIHPAFTDPTFDHVNDLVHHGDTGFEDLQSLALGMASKIALASAAEDEVQRLRGALEDIKDTVDNPGDNEGDFETLCGWMHATAMQALAPPAERNVAESLEGKHDDVV